MVLSRHCAAAHPDNIGNTVISMPRAYAADGWVNLCGICSFSCKAKNIFIIIGVGEEESTMMMTTKQLDRNFHFVCHGNTQYNESSSSSFYWAQGDEASAHKLLSKVLIKKTSLTSVFKLA